MIPQLDRTHSFLSDIRVRCLSVLSLELRGWMRRGCLWDWMVDEGGFDAGLDIILADLAHVYTSNIEKNNVDLRFIENGYWIVLDRE